LANSRAERSQRARAPAQGPAGREASGAGLLLTENLDLATRPPRLLERLSPAEGEMLLSIGQDRTLRPGETVFTQGLPHKGIFLIHSGRIRVFYGATSGREITLAYWSPGNFVGGPEIYGSSLHTWSAEALGPTRVTLLPSDKILALVPRMPQLALGLIEGLVFKGQCYSALAQILGTRSVTERLPILLRHLVNLYGVRTDDGIAITEPMTHEEIARMVGSTRQWVTTSLNRLQAEGVIAMRSGVMVIRKST
jgi:CRP/FNR family transcriptional regulator, cyclic AMP receptor protein